MGTCRRFASSYSSSSAMPATARIWLMIRRMWRTACTMSPVPGSPFVRIIVAPSAMRRSASPKSRAPHTNGTANAFLSMWWTSSAGESTSLSST